LIEIAVSIIIKSNVVESITASFYFLQWVIPTYRTSVD